MKFRLVEENELEKRAKYHRKRQKGMSPFYSPDGGNVPLAMDKFNNSTAEGANGLCEEFRNNKYCTEFKIGDRVKFRHPGGCLSRETATITGYDKNGFYTFIWDDGEKSWGCADDDFVLVKNSNHKVESLKEDFELLDSEPVDISYKDFYNLVDTFFQEYKSVQAEDNPDMMYDIQRNFYRKYRPFVDKCKNVMNSINATGYGRNDYYLLKIRDLCKIVDNNFPYGWKPRNYKIESLKEDYSTYKGYDIEYNFYGDGEYSVQYCGDDVIFETEEEARNFIDEIS